MLSIIIPTLNEEKYLPVLLSSLRNQNLKEPYEIIVADAGSKDKTVEMARSYGSKVVKGGLPARGRNEGAKNASGDLLLFLDADLFVPQGFLKKSLDEFRKRELAVASYKLIPRTESLIVRNGFNLFYNWPITLYQNFIAHGAMGIMVKKNVFHEVSGFDEGVRIAEDHYFVKLASKVGKFGIIGSTKIYIPLRRFEKDGYVKTGFKYLLCGLHMYLIGPVRSDIINYKFNHYNKC